MIAPSSQYSIVRQLQTCEQSIRAMPSGDDVFQDVCVRVLRNAATRDWSKNQYGFVHKANHDSRVDWNRRERCRRACPLPDDSQDKLYGNEPFEKASTREGSSILNAQLDSLSPRQREVLKARFWEGLSFMEIAHRLKVPVETVKSRFKRGLAKLRNSHSLRPFCDGSFTY